MKKNIGIIDRVVRLIAGIIIIANVLILHDMFWKVLFVIVGIFCIFEAAVSWCVLYAALGKDTYSPSCNVKK